MLVFRQPASGLRSKLRCHHRSSAREPHLAGVATLLLKRFNQPLYLSLTLLPSYPLPFVCLGALPSSPIMSRSLFSSPSNKPLPCKICCAHHYFVWFSRMNSGHQAQQQSPPPAGPSFEASDFVYFFVFLPSILLETFKCNCFIPCSLVTVLCACTCMCMGHEGQGAGLEGGRAPVGAGSLQLFQT